MWIDIIAALVSIASIYAAYLNSDTTHSNRLWGLRIWTCTNPIFVMLFYGMYVGWWEIHMGLIPTILMYLVFCLTSVRGVIKNGK